MAILNKKIIVAIDGGPGTGKSTVADFLAKELDIVHVDTGAIFRTIGYFFILNNIDITEENIINNLEKIDVILKYEDLKTTVLLNGKNVTDFIRTNEVSMAASKVCKIKEVRKKVLEIERNMSKENSVVLDGQDIGTVVFPNANFKFYFVCSMEKRAKKRTEDLNKKGQNVSFEEVKELLEKRDFEDRNRKEAPIKKADDAIEIDTTMNTVEDTGRILVDIILKGIEK